MFIYSYLWNETESKRNTLGVTKTNKKQISSPGLFFTVLVVSIINYTLIAEPYPPSKH